MDHCRSSGSWHWRGIALRYTALSLAYTSGLARPASVRHPPEPPRPTIVRAILQGSSARRTRRVARAPLPPGNRASVPPVLRRTEDPARSPGQCHLYVRPPSHRSQQPAPPCASRTGMRHRQPSRQTAGSSRGKQPRMANHDRSGNTRRHRAPQRRQAGHRRSSRVAAAPAVEQQARSAAFAHRSCCHSRLL